MNKAVHNILVTSLSTEALLAALRLFIARRWKPSSICSDKVTYVHGDANEYHAIQKCFNPDHRWQQYRISLPLKDANGNLLHDMDLTSDDDGKQQ